MAICGYCYHDMLSGLGCDAEALHRDGKVVDRILYGREHPSWGDIPNCGDCGTPKGSLHHPGCDVEQCRCGNQAITCACRYDEDPSQEWEQMEDRWDEDQDELIDLLTFTPTTLHVNAETGQSTLVRQELPSESVTIPLVFKHRDIIESIASWNEKRSEHPIDHHLLALVLDSLVPRSRTGSDVLHANDRDLLLKRSMISQAVNRARVQVGGLSGDGPPYLADTFAAAIVALNDLGVLVSNCDPLGTLLQPLHCHFGWEPPTRTGKHVPRPDCRCFLNYDPFQPSHLVQVRVRSGQLMEAFAPSHCLGRSSGAQPLGLFVQAVAELGDSGPEYGLVRLALLGQIAATNQAPRLWIYGEPHVPGPYQVVSLSDNGVPFWAHEDKRFRTNHRWEEVPVHQASYHFHYHPGQSQSRLKD